MTCIILITLYLFIKSNQTISTKGCNSIPQKHIRWYQKRQNQRHIQQLAGKNERLFTLGTPEEIGRFKRYSFMSKT